jgi:hypothetical protein
VRCPDQDFRAPDPVRAESTPDPPLDVRIPHHKLCACFPAVVNAGCIFGNCEGVFSGGAVPHQHWRRLLRSIPAATGRRMAPTISLRASQTAPLSRPESSCATGKNSYEREINR